MKVGVFCASSKEPSRIFVEKTVELGKMLATNGDMLVYGGGDLGLMGIIARTVSGAGARVIGITPSILMETQTLSLENIEQIVVEDMYDRKKMFNSMCDCFITLPGGLGSMDELFEVLTGAKLKLHVKPIGILNIDKFYDPLLAWLDRSLNDGFIPGRVMDHIRVSDSVPELMQMIADFDLNQ